MRQTRLVIGAALLAAAAWGCTAVGERPAEPPGGRAGQQVLREDARPGRGHGGAGAGEAERGLRRRGRRWDAAVIRLSAEQEQALGVRTMAVSARPFRTTLRAMGEVTVPLPRKAIVSCAFPARIARVHASVGAWVKRGQAVLTLQSDEVGLAKAEYQKAQSLLDLARRNCEREKRLFDNGVGAEKTLLASENELKMAEANRLAAERRLRVFGMSDAEIRGLADDRSSPAELTLTAPIEGKVVESAAVLGAMVDASHQILTLVDTRVLWVDAEIYERDIAQVRLGQQATVQVPAYPDEVFEGAVVHVGDIVKPDTRTIGVRVEVSNAGQRLKPGMFASAVFRTGERPSVVALPAQVILDDEDGHLVFVRTPAGYEPRLVDLGTQDNGNREVVRGIAPGDEVVVAGHYQLKSRLHADALRQGTSH
ncbi:MAG TPA: efflux RND transporter periplasmic adaptor subunit [Vicinamibacterales bacterium]|nr:efflux RND transporter periplasmic adaptor subunit [Vicinamibacterales bacterium]